MESPTFILVAVFECSTHGEGRKIVQKEIESVIVTKDDNHVGVYVGEPTPNGRKAIKERLPIRLVLQSFGDCAANRGDMRGTQHADDICHNYCPARTSRALNSSTLTPVC